MDIAILVLEDGTLFKGRSLGFLGKTFGEIVFCTAMTGYQETLTDPSYFGQIVASTAAQVGNTGWNDEDNESLGPELTNSKIWAAGFVIKNYTNQVSNWRATTSLADKLMHDKIVAIKDIDTRKLVKHIREKGALRAGIFSGAELKTETQLLQEVKIQPAMLGADLASHVSTSTPYFLSPPSQIRFRVVTIDLGMKTNIARNFLAANVELVVLPRKTSFEELLSYCPDGVFLSNGPGDPSTTDDLVELVKQVLDKKLPFFGICFGNQIFARALGKTTYKMKFGHHGINIPVFDSMNNKVLITSQNHGFAVAAEKNEEFSSEFGLAKVTHYCANDSTVEGLRLMNAPAFSVQFHPEAAAGPNDARHLFNQFFNLITETKK